MAQKHKLIELICERNGDNYYQAERIADYLIENGVVVLPCKVGDTVYKVWYAPCHNGETYPDSCGCDGCCDICDIQKKYLKLLFQTSSLSQKILCEA